MPEGPEVKRYVDQLNAEAAGQLLKGIEIVSGRYSHHGPPSGLQKFSQNFPILLKDIKCKGKFIYFNFEKDDKPFTIWNTLGMSGGWKKQKSEHSRLTFSFENVILYFEDQRNFGTFHFISPEAGETKKKLATLGPDILAESLTDQEFSKRLNLFSEKSIVEALMNQKAVSGIGNYLKSETLYLAKISPFRKVKDLNADDISRINSVSQQLIRESYKSGGSTFKIYQDMYGQTGSFSSRFVVYKKDKDPFGNIVNISETADGRTTYWVPSIQK